MGGGDVCPGCLARDTEPCAYSRIAVFAVAATLRSQREPGIVQHQSWRFLCPAWPGHVARPGVLTGTKCCRGATTARGTAADSIWRFGAGEWEETLLELGLQEPCATVLYCLFSEFRSCLVAQRIRECRQEFRAHGIWVVLRPLRPGRRQYVRP